MLFISHKAAIILYYVKQLLQDEMTSLITKLNLNLATNQ